MSAFSPWYTPSFSIHLHPFSLSLTMPLFATATTATVSAIPLYSRNRPIKPRFRVNWDTGTRRVALIRRHAYSVTAVILLFPRVCDLKKQPLLRYGEYTLTHVTTEPRSITNTLSSHSSISASSLFQTVYCHSCEFWNGLLLLFNFRGFVFKCYSFDQCI